jgi:hypothetical protein
VQHRIEHCGFDEPDGNGNCDDHARGVVDLFHWSAQPNDICAERKYLASVVLRSPHGG